jgi:hypothetical protein
MSQAEALYHLQTFDLQLLQKQQRLKTIETALNNDQQVVAAQGQVDAAQNALHPLRTQTRNLELELQSNVTKTKTAEDQLYSGRVRLPKELQDLQHEIQALKKRHGELENKLLTLMIAVEEAEGALAAAEARLQEAHQSQVAERTKLLQEQALLQAEVKTLQAQRAAAANNVTPENLKLYTALRPKKANQPISLMQGHSCTLCGVEQTMAVAQQVRQAQKLVYCTSCERILVYLG